VVALDDLLTHQRLAAQYLLLDLELKQIDARSNWQKWLYSDQNLLATLI
jgi:hypothetical protein